MSKLGKGVRIMQQMLAAHQTNKIKVIAIARVDKRIFKLIIVCIIYRKRTVVVCGNIRKPDGECLVIDCFDIIFTRIKINQWYVVYAKYLETGIATVAKMERVTNIVNEATGRRGAICITCFKEL